MLDQFLRLLRFRPVSEIGGSADDRHGRVGPDPYRNHVLGDLFAIPHAGIETLRDNIDQAVVADYLDLDVRVLTQKLGKLGQQDGAVAFSVAVIRTVPEGFSRSSLKAASSVSISSSLGPT